MHPAPLVLRGITLSFRADPFEVGPEAAFVHEADGAVLMRDGLIADAGPAAGVIKRHPGIPVEHHPNAVIMAGFVDCHAHYPQVGVIASYGAQLIEWLEKYTFPAEMAFADPKVAARAAKLYLDQILANGTTTASIYCTSHPGSVDAIFAAAEKQGVRIAAGKVMMDRNAPKALLDTAELGYEESKSLIARWHGRARATYVVSPRFAPTSTEAQLEAASALWREHPATLMQTHMSESPVEIAWVKRLFPREKDYLGVYERYGLIGPGANFGHAIHLTAREKKRLRESGSGVSHCPTSNTFIGSGLFDLAGLRDNKTPIPVGLATDVGGGSSFSMLQTMKSAYEIAQLRGYSLHPVKAFYLATLGSARVMQLDGKIGNLATGHEADVVVLDLAATPLIAERTRNARDIAEALFILMILGDDRAIRQTYSGGRLVHDRDAFAAKRRSKAKTGA